MNNKLLLKNTNPHKTLRVSATKHSLYFITLFSLLFLSCTPKKVEHKSKLTPEWFAVVDNTDSILFRNNKPFTIRYIDSAFRKLKNPSVEDSCYYYRFFLFLAKDNDHDYKRAYDYVDSIKAILTRNNALETSSNMLAFTYYWQGDLLFQTRNYKAAYDAYFKGKTIAEKNTDPCELGNFYYRLGMVLYRQERYDQSLLQFEKCLELSKKCPKDFVFHSRKQELMDNIGLCYFHLNQFDKALKKYQDAIRYIDEETNPHTVFQDTLYNIARAVILGNMGSVYESTGQDSLAEDCYQKSISVNKRHTKEINDAIITELKLCNLYLQAKQNLKFWNQLTECKSLIDSNDNPVSRQKWYELMATHLLDRDSLLSLRYFLISKKLHDSLTNADKAIKSIDLTGRINDLENEQKIEALEQNNSNKKFFLTLSTTVAILAVAYILFIVFYLKKLRKYLKQHSDLNEKVTKQKEELERAIHKLEIAYNEKDKILNIVAHDLRSPINSIYALADLLLHDDTLTNDQRETLDLIKTASQNSLGLSKEILESAILMQSKELSLSDINFNELLANTVSLLRFRATEKNLQLDLQMVKQPQYLKLDKDKIQRVINNLITNAIKFSRAKTTIYILMKKEEKGIHVSVKDMGIGIPEKIKPIIFEMFTEAKREGTGGEKAYGLGLSISKQIIESHGGKIWFESKEGEGSTFHYYLPFHFTEPEI